MDIINSSNCSCWIGRCDNVLLKNPIDHSIHFCKDRIRHERYVYPDDADWWDGESDGDCIARKDGSFWVVNSEYGDDQVSFCPHCGAKAPNQSLCERD